MTETFSWLDYTIFVAYLVASAAVGLLSGGKGKTLSDYFLADRGVNRYIVAMTIMAALFSGISYLAAPAEVYQHGIGFTIVILSFFIATPFTAIWLIPHFYNSRYFTAYHYFHDRFGLSVRLLASGLFIVRVAFWLGAATFAPALAIKAVTGLPLSFTILCTGLVSTIYTMKGGMKAVIWTDVMQLCVLFGGQLLIIIVGTSMVEGGVMGVWETAKAGGRLNVSLEFNPQIRITLWAALIGGAFLNLVQMATDQVSVQRYLTAGSMRDAQKSLWIKLWLFLPVFGVFYGTGLVLYAFYQKNPDPEAAKLVASAADQILPYFVVTQLPAGLPGLLIAAIFAASMSTISAGINSLTSATLCDFYQTLEKAKVPEQVQVRRAKWWTLVYGVLVTLLAFVFAGLEKGLIESVNTLMGLIGGPMLGLLLLGIFTKTANTPGALIGCLAGLVVGAFLTFYKVSLEPGRPPVQMVSFLWFTMISSLTTLGVGLLTSVLFGKRSAPHQ